MTRVAGRSRARIPAAAAVTALIASLIVVVGPASPAAAVGVDPNPIIPKQCGIAVTLVLDASGSVESSGAVDDVSAAAEAFLDGFQDTGSTARVIQFATFAEQLAPRRIVDTESMQNNGVFREAIEDYYNPIPPRPGNRQIKRYNGGSITSPGSFSASNSSNQYTNWDQVLKATATDSGDLVVFITDGDPTAYDFTRSGDPFTPNDVAVGTDRTTQSAESTIDRARQSANSVKGTGARVLAVGVGAALQNPASVERLTQVSGDDVVDDIADFNIETTDVALIADFGDLADAARGLVLELCSPSLTIRKFAQSADDATYQPDNGWDMTVTPTVPGGFDWVLPTSAAGPSATVTTSNGGFAQFQWDPAGDAEVQSAAEVVETMEPGFSPGRPGANNDFRCELRNADGDVQVEVGELTDAGGTASFELTGIGNEIGTCSVYNSFDYAPDIEITKVNAPTEVRGDLSPAATVTSTYEVTNPGNTPLSSIQVTDDRCGPVTPKTNGTEPIPGDDGDAVLAPDSDETWTLSCTRPISVGLGAPGPSNIVNTVTVHGSDPAGTIVTDQATDDVDVFVPQIELVKLVDGEDSITITAGESVTYTYEVTNTGETALNPVVLVDDTPPCEDPTPDPGNAGPELGVGETWLYSCTATPTGPVHNTGIVTGTPINPVTDEPFEGDNPDVTAIDDAEVNTIDPGLTLTKTVDQPLVAPGTEVTYTYVATNEGDTDLRNDTGNAGWVTDNRCSPVEQVLAGAANVGDVNTDDLMNPGESWQFTCSAEISVRTINIAAIVAQPVVAGDPVGDTLLRRARALVDVPGIAVNKVALEPVVLDPGAEPIDGPDFPDRRPARYAYDVDNTSTVPLRDVVLGDDLCAAMTFVGGDDDGDSVLDPSEVWQYTCETTALSRDDATPPGGNTSGVVTNTATVTGTPFLPADPSVTGPPVTDTDIAQVLVIEPSLTLTKTPSASVVRAGGSVTYTFAVANTGTVGLDVTALTDDKCQAVEYVSGDLRANGILDGWDGVDGVILSEPETWTFTCSRSIALPPAGETADENIATVAALDPLGNTYDAEATAVVRVIDPAIDLVKTVDEHLVPVGYGVNYTFVVTNVGLSPVEADDVLAQIELRDVAVPALPSCREPVRVDPAPGADDLLDRGDVWTYTCAATITADTVNVAGVVGFAGTTLEDITPFPVVDFDTAYVGVFHPAIEVIKSADPTTVVEPGGDVTYTYEVRNTGDVPLSDVAERITDDTCAPVEYVSGDEDEDGLLDTPTSIFEDSLDEVWIFECSMFIDAPTTNVVVVTGTPTDPDGTPLCAVPEGNGDGPAVLAVTIPCDATDDDTAFVGLVAPLPPTGGQITGAALGVAAMLIALGVLLMRARRPRARRP